MATERDAWNRRATATYNPGDLVIVGPAYRGNGQYAPDGAEGIYTVIRPLPPGDYYITHGDQASLIAHDSSGPPWDYIMSASRMTPAKLCVKCRTHIAAPELIGGEPEKCEKCGDVSPAVEPDPVPVCLSGMGCLCAGHAGGLAASEACNAVEAVCGVNGCEAYPGHRGTHDDGSPIDVECGNRSCHAPAVAILTCCGRVYARCAAHGGEAGAARSRGAHRGLHECQKPGRAGAGKAVR